MQNSYIPDQAPEVPQGSIEMTAVNVRFETPLDLFFIVMPDTNFGRTHYICPRNNLSVNAPTIGDSERTSLRKA